MAAIAPTHRADGSGPDTFRPLRWRPLHADADYYPRFLALRSRPDHAGRIHPDGVKHAPTPVRPKPCGFPTGFCPATWKALFQLRCSRSEEHTSELQSLMRISYAVFCLTKKKPRCHNATDPKHKNI